MSKLQTPEQPQTPPPTKSLLLSSNEATRFYGAYDHVKRARSLTPNGTRSPAMRDSDPIRRRMKTFETVDDAVELLKSAQNVIVLAGAGISTSVGIPDFRSKDGLYNGIAKKRFADPQELFTKATFCDAPLDFYSDVRPIIPKLRTADQGGQVTKPEDIVSFIPKFSATHAFFNLLDDKNKLRTIYTQNIDGLEKAAGVEASQIINCHGSWDTATCMTCKGKASADAYLPVVHQGSLPLCMCAKPVEREPGTISKRPMRDRPKKAKEEVEYLQTTKPKLRKAESTSSLKKRKRNDQDETEDPQSRPGLLKPDVTFFDEGISKAYEPRLLQDATKVDLFIIIGTSLPVEPVNKLPFTIPDSVPQIWISREYCKRAGLKVDIELLGDCDVIVEELCRRSGWSKALENRIWRNRYGSSQQAKGQLDKLKTQRSQSAKGETATESVKPVGLSVPLLPIINTPRKLSLASTEGSPLRKVMTADEPPAEQAATGALKHAKNAGATIRSGIESESQVTDLPIMRAKVSSASNTPDQPGEVTSAQVAGAVALEDTKAVINAVAAASNHLALRPAYRRQARRSSIEPDRSLSPSRGKTLLESKMKVEVDFGVPWRWYIRKG